MSALLEINSIVIPLPHGNILPKKLRAQDTVVQRPYVGYTTDSNAFLKRLDELKKNTLVA